MNSLRKQLANFHGAPLALPPSNMPACLPAYVSYMFPMVNLVYVTTFNGKTFTRCLCRLLHLCSCSPAPRGPKKVCLCYYLVELKHQAITFRVAAEIYSATRQLSCAIFEWGGGAHTGWMVGARRGRGTVESLWMVGYTYM